MESKIEEEQVLVAQERTYLWQVTLKIGSCPGHITNSSDLEWAINKVKS